MVEQERVEVRAVSERAQQQRQTQSCYVAGAPLQPLAKEDLVGCLQAIGMLAVLGVVVIGLMYLAGMAIGAS